MIDGVWEATAVPDDAVQVYAYAKRTAVNSTGCQHLDEDDRWFAERGSSTVPGSISPEDAEEAIVGFLVGEGFRVDVYRSSHPRSEARSYWAERDEMVVDGTFNADGAITLHVTSGPCAPTIGNVDQGRWELDYSVGGD